MTSSRGSPVAHVQQLFLGRLTLAEVPCDMAFMQDQDPVAQPDAARSSSELTTRTAVPSVASRRTNA